MKKKELEQKVKELESKTAVLMQIIARLASSQVCNVQRSTFGHDDAHFISGDSEIEVGDIVTCVTSSWFGSHQWSVAEVAEIPEDFKTRGRLRLKDLITDEQCDMANEKFYKLRNFKLPKKMLEGAG